VSEWKKAGKAQRIEKLYAWVAEEADGGEGIVGWRFDGVGWTPLIGADKDRIESYRPYAEACVAEMGVPVRLKVFGEGVVIDEIKP